MTVTPQAAAANIGDQPGRQSRPGEQSQPGRQSRPGEQS